MADPALLHSLFGLLVIVQLLQFFWLIIFAISIHDEINDIPHQIVNHVGNGKLLVPAYWVIFLICCTSPVWSLVPIFSSKDPTVANRNGPTSIARRILKGWLLINFIVYSGGSLASLLLQVQIVPYDDCSRAANNTVISAWTQARPNASDPHQNLHTCNDLTFIQQGTLAYVIPSFLVSVVGLLMVYWHYISTWDGELSNTRYATNDWPQGLTGGKATFMRGLQVAASPLRLVWRIWCRHWGSLFWYLTIGLLFVAIIIVLFILVVVPIGIVKWSIWLHQKMPYSSSYKQRAAARAKKQENLELKKVVIKRHELGTSCLERILAMEDLFYELLPHLHGINLPRLRAVSRATKAAFDQHGRRKMVRSNICHRSEKACWVCRTRICDECKVQPFTLKVEKLQTLQSNLQAVCTKCYFLNLCRPRDLFAAMNQRCATGACTSTLVVGAEDKPECCVNCQAVRGLKDKQLREHRMRKLGGNLGATYTFDPRRCGNCDASLWAFTLRWWRCSGCKKEHVHGPDMDTWRNFYGWSDRWRGSILGRTRLRWNLFYWMINPPPHKV